MKTFKPYTPDQLLLLPPALQDWLPEDHLALFLSDVVDHALDLTPILAAYETGDGRGQPPYHPALMVKLLVYALLHRQAVLPEDRAGDLRGGPLPRAGGQPAPRPRQHRRLPPAHLAGPRRAVHPGARPLPAGRARQARPRRPRRDEGAGQRLEAQGHELRADGRSRAEAGGGSRRPPRRRRSGSMRRRTRGTARGSAGTSCRPSWPAAKAGSPRSARPRPPWRRRPARRPPPPAPQPRRSCAERERQAETTGRKPKGRPPRVPDPTQAKPDPKAQRNFTDPESRIMKDGATKSFVQAYNAQVAVDADGAGDRGGRRTELPSPTHPPRSRVAPLFCPPVSA